MPNAAFTKHNSLCVFELVDGTRSVPTTFKSITEKATSSAFSALSAILTKKGDKNFMYILVDIVL